MAKFEISGFDTDAFLDMLSTISIDCPICNKSFEINLENYESPVICPHCKAKIEVESE